MIALRFNSLIKLEIYLLENLAAAPSNDLAIDPCKETFAQIETGKWSQAEKDAIREKISLLVGHDMGEIYPEFFFPVADIGQMGRIIRYGPAPINEALFLDVYFETDKASHLIGSYSLN
jgi:hypothetical protein